jgi:hypothetical protein
MKNLLIILFYFFVVTVNASLPTVTTTDAYKEWSQGFFTGGSGITDGGGTISARGVCYSTDVSPNITDSHTHDGITTGAFVSTVHGLTKSTTYHVRAYATNETGTSYGYEVSFTTPDVSYTRSTNK